MEALCFGDMCNVRAVILTPWVDSCSFCVCPLEGALTRVYLPDTHLEWEALKLYEGKDHFCLLLFPQHTAWYLIHCKPHSVYVMGLN